jgi:hypothetical protein
MSAKGKHGLAWNGTTYRSLTEIAFAMTGTRWPSLLRPTSSLTGADMTVHAARGGDFDLRSLEMRRVQDYIFSEANSGHVDTVCAFLELDRGKIKS